MPGVGLFSSGTAADAVDAAVRCVSLRCWWRRRGVCQETFEDTYLKRRSPVWHLARCGVRCGRMWLWYGLWFWGRPACGCGVALPVVVFVVSCGRDCGRSCLRLWRRPGSCLRLRVSCLRAFASACLYANGDSPAPASAWLSGQGSSLCVSCVVSCVRCELLAVRAQEP